jgi:hypothetical protein
MITVVTFIVGIVAGFALGFVVSSYLWIRSFGWKVSEGAASAKRYVEDRKRSIRAGANRSGMRFRP